MKIGGIYSAASIRHYEIRGEMTTDEFILLANRLAAAFDVVAKLIWIPEADIANIHMPDGRIYVKYDVSYGLEIESTGLSDRQQAHLEKILFAF